PGDVHGTRLGARRLPRLRPPRLRRGPRGHAVPVASAGATTTGGATAAAGGIRIIPSPPPIASRLREMQEIGPARDAGARISGTRPRQLLHFSHDTRLDRAPWKTVGARGRPV